MDELKMQNGALILEGGSLRSLFTSGVLDVFMEHNLYFSDVTGVSAGSLTGVNYVSRQPGRSAKLNIDYVNDKRYLGVNISSCTTRSLTLTFCLTICHTAFCRWILTRFINRRSILPPWRRT